MDTTQPPRIEPAEQGSPNRQNVKRPETVDGHERDRDFLSEAEVEALLAAARKGRFGTRDHTMLLLMYRHGFRVSELVALRRDAIDLDTGRVWVKRKKAGLSTHQPLSGEELRALRTYFRSRADSLPWAFLSSQKGQITRQNVNYLIKKAGQRAGIGHVHPHMLRHSCGHALANKGMDTRLMQDWLGHRDIRHTAWYSRTSAKRFDGVWE